MEAGDSRWQMEGEAGEPSDLQCSFQLGKTLVPRWVHE